MVLGRDYRASLQADASKHRAKLAERARLSEFAAAQAAPASDRVSGLCIMGEPQEKQHIRAGADAGCCYARADHGLWEISLRG